MKDKPRVLFVDREGAHAIWSLLVPVSAELERDGWSSGFVCMSDESGRTFPGANSSLGSHLVAVPRKKMAVDLLKQQYVFEKKFREIIAQYNPDVVHVNFAVPGIWARRVAKQAGVRYVIATQHELFGSMSFHLRLGLLATKRYVDIHTYVSNTVAESFGVPRDIETSNGQSGLQRHMVVRNGVDHRLISSIKCGIDYSPMRIVAPGRLFKVKGHRLILKAFKEVLRAYPYAKLVIAGIGPEDTSLRQLSVSLGISNAVDFAGWLPRESLWQLIADSAMAVFASDGTQEGFGLALAEAAFLRTPIVASHIGAFREVLAHSDKAASWFSPDSIGELAEALKTAFERTKEDIEQQTSTAYAMAIQRASQSAMTEKYSRLYEQILCQLPTRDDMDVE